MLIGGEKYVSNVTLSDLNKSFARRQMYEAMANIASENEPKIFNTETIKAITSGDSIQMEGKYEKPFSAAITAKLIFSLNNLITYLSQKI